ncbi:SHS2 domain-containing protein [Thermodesulfovibrio aggregans]|uniref:Protein archease n=1 Tax=Thermodesulfovibrio aggregans TaxID=86166 RepID=A0A0U9HNX8_9BACT|nr:archease [Thermodesulfovibrio aggregans]GAQ94169.1 SHS2 domain-containing protein [Thermodesulfovibrio aggregans]
MSYRAIDVAGDIGLRAEGKTLEECFVNAGLGLYSLITDINLVKPAQKSEISISEETLEDLLVSFLNELIFQFDAYGFIGREIKLELKEKSLKAEVYGESFNPEKHERKLLVKAATYHNLVLKKENDYWIAEIIFDI